MQINQWFYHEFNLIYRYTYRLGKWNEREKKR